jgi:hypothetical protein
LAPRPDAHLSALRSKDRRESARLGLSMTDNLNDFLLKASVLSGHYTEPFSRRNIMFQ